MLGITRTVVLLGLVSLFTDLSTEMIAPLVPLFLANVLGASMPFIGLVEGIAEATASLTKIGSGWLSDRLRNRKGLILIGYGLSSITKPLLAIAASGWHVLGVRFADRVGKGIRGAPRDALIADVVEPSVRGRAYGIHRAMDTMGAILGPLAAFLLLQFFTYRPLFLASAIPALIAVGIIVVGVRERGSGFGARGSDPGVSGERRATPARLRQRLIRLRRKRSSGERRATSDERRAIPREFIVLITILAIFTLGNSSDVFLILRSQGLGVRIAYIPLLWLAFNLTYSLMAIPAGILSDKIGRRWMITAGLAIYALSYAGFALASSAWHVWLLFPIYGLYYGVTDGAVRAYVADVVPADRRATAFGIYHFVVGILLLPANLLFGWIWKIWSPEAAFGLGAILAAGAAVSLITVFTVRADARMTA